MPEARAVIFDMDGVLVDSYHAHLVSWQKACAEHGVELEEHQFARCFGRTSREMIQELWPREMDDTELAAFDERKEGLYRDIVRREFPAADGARELVRALRDAGFRLAVGSSGPPANIDLVLDALDARDEFDAIVSGRDVTRGKPDPQVFLIAAERIGVRPARCAVIEDAAVGLEAASAAGMIAIGYVGTGRTAEELAAGDVVVHSLRELSPERIGTLLVDR